MESPKTISPGSRCARSSGPDLWDAAARFTPDWFLESTFPQMRNSDTPFDFKSVELLKLDSIAKKEKNEGAEEERTGTIRDVLSLGSVLGSITFLMTQIGIALLGVFALFFVLQQVFGTATGQGVTAGWGLARLFISLTFLMPIGGNDKDESSFCVIQGILVVCAQTGIGLANKTWDAAMSNFTDLMKENDGAAEAAAEEILRLMPKAPFSG